MSLTAAQIFVRTDDAETVERVVAEALAEWATLVGAPVAYTQGALPPPPDERRVVLMPAFEGWVTVVEESGRLDRSMARNIHARTGAFVIAAELDGHFLVADLEAIDEEGETESWSVPDTSGDPALMPVYEDAEAEFWTRLRAYGVPGELIATDWEELLNEHAPWADGARIMAEAGRVGLDKLILPFRHPAETDLVDGPRVRPDLWVANESGDAQVIEARRVTGEWTAASVAALARIEEAQTARILATLAWTAQTDELPALVFNYDGADDSEIFHVALHAARATRPGLVTAASRKWLSIQGLEKEIRARVAQTHPAFEVGKSCLDRLELRHGEYPSYSFLLDLGELWQAYATAPDALALVIDKALDTLLHDTFREETFDQGKLFPLLLGADTPDLATFAARPLVDGVFVALGHDTGRSIRPLERETLKGSGLGFDDALELAVHRMELATEENDEFVLYEQPEGTTLIAEFPDVGTSTRILSSAVRAHVAQQLGDECWVAIPTRDSFLGAESTPEGLRWIEREVRRRFESGNLPLTLMIWSVQNGDLVEFREAGRLD